MQKYFLIAAIMCGGCTHFDRQVVVGLARQAPHVIKVHLNVNQRSFKHVVGAEHNYVNHQPPGPLQPPITYYNLQASERQWHNVPVGPLEPALPVVVH